MNDSARPTLGELIAGLPCTLVRGDASLTVSDLVLDSRTATPGALFIAVPGTQANGADFIADAIERGATAILGRALPPGTSAENDAAAGVLPDGVAYVETMDPMQLLPDLARRFFRDPAAGLQIIGITGTNGKSTTTYLVRAVLEQANRSAAVIGTLGYVIGETTIPAPNTTPDALLLTRMLAACRDAGVSDVVMEVSSHALSLGRVAGLNFAAAVFTNLTQDHLDFHGTMEHYFEAKAGLFKITNGRGAVNIEDAYGRELKKRYPDLLTFGAGGDLDALNPQLTLKGTYFTLRMAGREFPVHTRLVGMPNVQNALAAAAAAHQLGISPEVIVAGLEAASAPRGRFELVETSADFAIAVDYAHTPDALQRLLDAGRALDPRRLLLVFGCGGDRDRTKRPQMGSIAAHGADEVWLTSDNPRTEDPERILDEIEAGMRAQAPPGSRWHRMADRRAAIYAAVDSVTTGDLLLVAGKGHEDYQILGREKRPFDDAAVVREALRTAGK